MSHLLRFRKGWQSEHLARFILSKFSFIAEPNNISDDLGSDFFCTLFTVKNNDFLLPQNSIAIQVKSNKRRIDVSNKLDYLMNLEMPFFVVTVDKRKNTITLYSGESIPFFFSKYGNPSTLSNKPKTYIILEKDRDNRKLFSSHEEKYFMHFPKIIEIPSHFEYEKDITRLDNLKNIISVIQKNVSAKRTSEYLFDFVGEDNISVFAGDGSVETYRDNLCKRLCEAMLNVKYIINEGEEGRIHEFIMYETIYFTLKKYYGRLPSYLTSTYKNVKVEFSK